MKTKLTLALMALITSSAFAAIPKVLPEFKNEKQLAEWRDEMAAKHATTTTTTEDHAFYTGKPYVETTGSYAFKYRSYNPQLARWTSEDPSGFPDGANNSIYVNNWVLCSVDSHGLNIVHINNTNAVGGKGHSGVIIGNSDSGYTYHSYGPKSSGSGASYDTANGQNFTTLEAALNHASGLGYNRYQGWNSTPEQDAAAREAFGNFAKDGYNATLHNCINAVQAALTAGEVQYTAQDSFLPNQFFNLNMPPFGSNDFNGNINPKE